MGFYISGSGAGAKKRVSCKTQKQWKIIDKDGKNTDQIYMQQ
jgi:hypothetical protein